MSSHCLLFVCLCPNLLSLEAHQIDWIRAYPHLTLIIYLKIIEKRLKKLHWNGHVHTAIF